MELIYLTIQCAAWAIAITCGCITAFLFIKSFIKWDIVGISIVSALLWFILACCYCLNVDRIGLRGAIRSVFFRTPRRYLHIKKTSRI